MRSLFDVYKVKNKWVTLNNLFFVATFLLYRAVFTPILISYIQMHPDISLFLKLSTGSMYYLSMIWAWMIVNMASKQLAEMAPNNKAFQQGYKLMRSLRKYKNIYYLAMLPISINWLLRDKLL